MDPSPEPPPQNINPNETPPISMDIPPDAPIYMIAMRPCFPEPDPIRAAPKDYLPDREELGKYMGQLKAGLQTLVQGPLDYRLVSFMNSWNGQNIRIEQMEFDVAACLVTAVLDAGPCIANSSQTSMPLEAEDWGTLASSCLAAIAHGFTRPLKEATRNVYIAEWENLEDNPQCKLDDSENTEFHSLLQWLKATTQHLDIHINADESDGLCRWTATVQKEVEETARCAAASEVDMALHSWKLDQLNIRQKQLKETLNRTLLEHNIDLLCSTAEALGLSIGDPATIPQSRPAPSIGSKRTASGSMPLPALPLMKAKPTFLPRAADAPAPQAPQVDVITLTATVQMAMQPFMVRLEAAERRSAPAHPINLPAPVARPPPTST